MRPRPTTLVFLILMVFAAAELKVLIPVVFAEANILESCGYEFHDASNITLFDIESCKQVNREFSKRRLIYDEVDLRLFRGFDVTSMYLYFVGIDDIPELDLYKQERCWALKNNKGHYKHYECFYEGEKPYLSSDIPISQIKSLY